MKKLFNKLRLLNNKLNCMFFALLAIALTGGAMLSCSFFIQDYKMQNVFVGLGTGLLASSIVSISAEIINKQNIKNKICKYKLMLLNPISKITESIYVNTIVRINEFLLDKNQSASWIVDLNDDYDELKKFIEELKKIDYLSENEANRKRLDELLNLPIPYYKEAVSLYYNIPFDTLLWEGLITQDEYNKLKSFWIVDKCKESIYKSTDNFKIDSQVKYTERIQLFERVIELIKKIINIFDFTKSKAEYHSKDIVEYLDYKYYRDVYCNSDEYIIQQLERNESEMDYYLEHPDEIPEYIEETAEDKLHKEINQAIWTQDKEKIIELFPKISKTDIDTKKLFTWQLSDKLMKDKVLRQLYLEKYGIKYKPDKNICQKLIGKSKRIVKKIRSDRK